MDEEWKSRLTPRWEATRPWPRARSARCRCRWRSAAGWRSSVISCSPRAHRQLAGRLPRHRPATGGMAGARDRDLCGRLVAPGVADDRSRSRSAPRAHRGAGDVRRPARLPSDRRGGSLRAGPVTGPALERLGVAVSDGVDLRLRDGRGHATVLVRAGTLRPDRNPPLDATPTDDRPWLAGMERLDDPRLARRFVTSRVLYRRLRRYLWAPPLALAVIASCCTSSSSSTGSATSSARHANRPHSNAPTTPRGPHGSL